VALNPYLVYFILFRTKEQAEAFPAFLPPDCTWKIQVPREETRPLDPGEQPEPWAVLVKGPWENFEIAEEILAPLAEQHGGEYNGEEEDNPL
jgi:hypothetical protein